MALDVYGFNEAEEKRRATNLPHAQFRARNENFMMGRKKILVVEDDAGNLLVEGAFLESLGYEYDGADNGVDALEKIRAGHYSLILMDVNIPGINGLALTRILRDLEAQGRTPVTPIIAMTAHAFSEDRQKCIDAGMNDYISKPFSQGELQAKLEKNLGIQVLLAPTVQNRR